MFQSGLLVLRISTALRRSSPLSVIQRCSQFVQKVLYVHIINDDTDFSDHCTVFNIPLVQGIRKYVTEFYTNASHVSQAIDVRFLLSNLSNRQHLNFTPHRLRHGCDVILTDLSSDQYVKLRNYIAMVFPDTPVETKVLHGLESLVVADQVDKEKFADKEPLDSFDYVALGGTFDRLHVGHKILLSESCLLCDKELVVGVTDGEMNNRKILPELMQLTSERIDTVSDFLHDIKPNIAHCVVPITDVYGPAVTESKLQCLVVSQETIRGWELINSKRELKGMPKLKLDVIEMVENANHSAEEEEKVSSSTSRIRLLGTLLSDQKAQKSYDRRPFMIGLTGGTASGKTSIGKRLEKLGAAVIDCDVLGHQSYQPGTPTYHRVIEAFGQDIVGADGCIDRKILGSKVFGNKEFLSRLNAIVWPAIAQLAAEEVKTLTDKGIEVVVLDAAVLLEAGWDAMVDEIWVAIIPKEEAIKRLVERNKLTEDQARQRINSQITNKERVTHADVVLCTFWEPEVTQKQVEKAWNLLQRRLNSSGSDS